MADLPSHELFVVTDRGEGKKGIWTKVGAMWPSRNGEGFSIEITQQLSVAGSVICLPRREQSERPESGPAQRQERPAARPR